MSKTKPMSDASSSDLVEIRNYPASLVYDHTSNDGRTYTSLSFRFKEKWASLFLTEGSVSQSVNRNGKPIEGRLNITLGNPDSIHNVSVQQDDRSYKRTPMYSKTILSSINENKQEYLKSIAV